MSNIRLVKSALYSWTPGTKSFKNAYYIYKKIASKATNSQELIRLFDGIDTIQTIFQEKQSISWNEFYNWHNKCSQDCQECDEPWLWVCAMCVTYGLRPSEIAAAQNLLNLGLGAILLSKLSTILATKICYW